MIHPRWERTEGDPGFFRDEDRLVVVFYVLAALSALLIGATAAGLWKLRAAVLAPPLVVGVASGHVFTSVPQPLSALHLTDLDRQFSDTVEVLFSRTEKGLPPALRDFCAPEVVSAIDADYRDAARQYPAGFVQTLALLESKPAPARPGVVRFLYRGLLSSRSLAAAQISPIYLDCTFARTLSTTLNSTGWRLVRVQACGRDDFYRDEVERARKEALGLP